MEVFDSSYYRVNKALLKFVGLWFLQNRTERIFIQTLFISILFLSMTPQIYGIYKDFYISINFYKTLIHLGSLLYFSTCFLKYATTIAAHKKLEAVFHVMADNWVELKNINEQKILAMYTARGQMLVEFYTICIALALVFNIIGPLYPVALDKVYPLDNGTRIRIHILYGEYGMDPVKNYNKIFIIESTSCVIPGFLVCAVDTMYVACIEHCLGLFAIVKYRLQLLSTKSVKNSYQYTSKYGEEDVHGLIINIVKLHQRIINFANQLESSYTTSFLFLILVNGMYITVLSVLIIKTKVDAADCFRFVATLMIVVVHLFYLFWPGQKMINYSTGLFNDMYLNEWYKCSVKTQNLLKFMTLRCIMPCYVTAGGICIMNFTNFASIVKTSVSYIAVLASLT